MEIQNYSEEYQRKAQRAIGRPSECDGLITSVIQISSKPQDGLTPKRLRDQSEPRSRSGPGKLHKPRTIECGSHTWRKSSRPHYHLPHHSQIVMQYAFIVVGARLKELDPEMCRVERYGIVRS
jgi:hypothetical protein